MQPIGMSQIKSIYNMRHVGGVNLLHNYPKPTVYKNAVNFFCYGQSVYNFIGGRYFVMSPAVVQ